MTPSRSLPLGIGKAPKKDGSSLAPFYSAAFRRFLHSVSPRALAIVSARYGATGKPPMTLQEIGKTYGITRERIRQIVSGLLRDVRGKRTSSPLEEVAKRIEWTLKKSHGILEKEAFFEAIAGDNSKERGAVRFFLAVLSDRFFLKETPLLRPSVLLSSFDLSKWESFNESVLQFFTDRKTSIAEKELLHALKKRSPSEEMSEEEMRGFLSVSKGVQKNPFDRWGFPSWSDICPRGTKERAYLVVEAEGKPLHFREIAERIDAKGLQKPGRTTHPQTVHNELIKDKRFVLVGRGTYALVEWGYRRGTVREVLEEVLREKKKPLKREELIAEVLKVRDVKESTIVINLNSFFARVGENRYFLKEPLRFE